MACFLLPSKNIFNHFFSQHFQSSKHSTVIKRKNRLIPCEKIQVQNVCCCQFWKERILLKSDSLSYRLAQLAQHKNSKYRNLFSRFRGQISALKMFREQAFRWPFRIFALKICKKGFVTSYYVATLGHFCFYQMIFLRFVISLVSIFI